MFGRGSKHVRHKSHNWIAYPVSNGKFSRLFLSEESRSEQSDRRKVLLNVSLTVIISLLLVLYCNVVRFNYIWPDAGTTTADDFQWDASRSHLEKLVAMGVRIVGSRENEIDTPAYLLDTLKKIQPADGCTLELDVQRPSGTFFHDGMLGGFTSVYMNVTNVVARLTWKRTHNQARLPAVLINAHFDTAPGSPGASDDGLGVAVMLEIARALAVGPTLHREVVLLFNGAEESNQQAAHGFITKHKWAKEIGVIINLEALGAGGRMFLFQCNSGRISELYGSVMDQPAGSVVGHELFKHILWRTAATDLRTFFNFGKPGTVGFDNAYVNNGHVYHTKHDDMEHVSDETLIHTGKNVLAFVRGLGQTDALTYEKDSMRLPPIDDGGVFFDVLNLWWINYSFETARILHPVIAMLGFLASMSAFKYDLLVATKAISLEILAIVASILASVGVGVVCTLIAPMRWYPHGNDLNLVLALMLYAPPAQATAIVMRDQLSWYLQANCYSSFEAESQLRGAVMTPWWILLLVTSSVGLASGFLAVPFLLGAIVANVVAEHLGRHGSWNSSTMRKGLRMFLPIPGVLIWQETCLILLRIFLAMLGKTGTEAPVDIILAAGVALMVVMGSGVVYVPYHAVPLESARLDFHRRSSSRSLMGNNNNNNNNVDTSPLSLPSSSSTSTSTSDAKRRLAPNDSGLRCGGHRSDSNLPSLGLAPASSSSSSPPPSPSSPSSLSRSSLFDGALGHHSSIVTRQIATLLWGITLFALIIAIPMRSYSESHPKRLFVQHISRTFYDEPNAKPSASDSGVWVTAMDYRTLRPLQHLSSKLDGRHEKDADSDLYDGSCYLDFPWYYPVANALRRSQYIPNAKAIIPQQRKLSIEITSRNAPEELLQYKDAWRWVNISLSGPDHMVVVLRDTHTAILREWSITSPLPPSRDEGVRYIQITSGLCDDDPVKKCRYNFWLGLEGDGLIDVAAYGHHMGEIMTPALQDLYEILPAWSQGGEWANFVSEHIRTHA